MKFLKLTPLAGLVALALAAGCTRTETSAPPAARANGVPDNVAHQGTGPGVPQGAASAPAGLDTATTTAPGGSGPAATGAAGSGVNPATGAGMGTVSGTNSGSAAGSAADTAPATGTAAGAGMGTAAGTGGSSVAAPPGGTGDTPRSPGTDRGGSRSGDNKGAALGGDARFAANGLDAARVVALPLVATAASAPAQELPRPGAASMTITTGDAASGAAVGSVRAGEATRMKSVDGALKPQAAASGIRAVAPGDRHFMDEAAVGGLFEVEAGKLAAERASDPALKEFGRMLVEDHGAANKELEAIANARSITLPSRLTQHQQSTLRSLSQQQGGKFDRQFVQEVGLKDHRSDIRKFESAAKKVGDPELKAFIEKTLPTLRKHHDHAQQLAKAGGRSGGSGGSGERVPTGKAVPQPGDKMTPQATVGTSSPAGR